MPDEQSYLAYLDGLRAVFSGDAAGGHAGFAELDAAVFAALSAGHDLAWADRLAVPACGRDAGC